MKALPNLSLPTSVEAFDSGLEPSFSWRSKDRGYSKLRQRRITRPMVSLNWWAP